MSGRRMTIRYLTNDRGMIAYMRRRFGWRRGMTLNGLATVTLREEDEAAFAKAREMGLVTEYEQK